MEPENIHLDSAGHARIADFGLAVRGGTEFKRIKEFACTQIYTATEVSMDLISDLI